MEMEITIKIKKDKEEREYELKDGEWVEIDENIEIKIQTKSKYWL